MKIINHILLGFFLVGMFASCSSDDSIAPEPTQPDGRKWNAINLNMGVEQGQASTRTIGDLDKEGLPRGAYPSNLGIYILGYDNGQVKGTLTLNEDGSDNGGRANFYYYVDKENNTVSLKSTPESEEVLKVAIRNEHSTWSNLGTDASMFFFASQNKINNVKFPELDPNENKYEDLFPNAHEEFGDKLFCTDGYIFKWKNESTLGLYLIIRNAPDEYEIKEIKEIKTWEKGDWDITMKRLTACVSIRLMIIDSYVSGSENTVIHKNIEGMDRPDIPFEEGVRLTNAAFRKYVDEKYPALADEMGNFNIENMLVRKKLFTNFPTTFDWKDGLLGDRGDERGSLYVCNLNHPAWIDAVTNYEHGKNQVHALTATCSNEPFVAADGKMVYGINMVLFLGYGERNTDDHEQGGSYDRLITLTIPFGDGHDTGSNPYHVTPNTRTYIYVGITLEDLVQLYKRLYIDENIEPRSASGINNLTISPKQVMVTSEPYIAE